MARAVRFGQSKKVKATAAKKAPRKRSGGKSGGGGGASGSGGGKGKTKGDARGDIYKAQFHRKLPITTLGIP